MSALASPLTFAPEQLVTTNKKFLLDWENLQNKRSQSGSSPLQPKEFLLLMMADEVPYIYNAGSRVDSHSALGSPTFAHLVSAQPLDLPKSIEPFKHNEHEEIVTPLFGEVAFEVGSRDSDALSLIRLKPGDHLTIPRGVPHRVSIAPLMERAGRGEGVIAGFTAIKVGKLGAKDSTEDMRATDHPMVKSWGKDAKWLKDNVKIVDSWRDDSDLIRLLEELSSLEQTHESRPLKPR